MSDKNTFEVEAVFKNNIEKRFPEFEHDGNNIDDVVTYFVCNKLTKEEVYDLIRIRIWTPEWSITYPSMFDTLENAKKKKLCS